MLRMILARHWTTYDGGNGGTEHKTVDVDLPEVERLLRDAASTYSSGWSVCGVEVLPAPAAEGERKDAKPARHGGEEGAK